MDEVILVGEVQTKPIYDGLVAKKFKKSNIHVINDVKLAFPLMQKLRINICPENRSLSPFVQLFVLGVCETPKAA